MKSIKLISGGPFPSIDVIKTIVERSGAEKGISPAEMRKRIRILDSLDAVKEGDDRVDFEDADYELLKSLTGQFKFNIAHRDLLAVVDAIEFSGVKPEG